MAAATVKFPPPFPHPTVVLHDAQIVNHSYVEGTSGGKKLTIPLTAIQIITWETP
jgi:hypothetical protein